MSREFQHDFEMFPDFPITGVNFFDIGSLIAMPDWHLTVARAFKEIYTGPAPDCIVGVDSRGFIFATVASQVFGTGLVMARKPGKLPGLVVSMGYGKEYGKDSIELQSQRIVPGKKYLLVDDILATGNTVRTVADIVVELGGEVCGVLVYGEIAGLNGREALKKYNVYNCVTLYE